MSTAFRESASDFWGQHLAPTVIAAPTMTYLTSLFNSVGMPPPRIVGR